MMQERVHCRKLARQTLQALEGQGHLRIIPGRWQTVSPVRARHTDHQHVNGVQPREKPLAGLMAHLRGMQR